MKRCYTVLPLTILTSHALATPNLSKNGRVIIDLQTQHEILSPSERMQKIANACEDFGIDSFDIYGDFQKS